MDKIVAWSYIYAQEFAIMNMPYEMFLTIQLMHLTCGKDRVQFPTRKEGWDLFQRTSEDNSRNNPRIKNNMMNAVMWHCWVIFLMQNLPAMKKYLRRKGRRVPVQEKWCLGCGIETWREVRSIFHMDLEDIACNRSKHHGI